MENEQKDQSVQPHPPGAVISPSSQAQTAPVNDQPQAVPQPVTAQPQPTPVPPVQPTAVPTQSAPTPTQTVPNPPQPPMPSTQPGVTQPFNLRDVPDQKDRKKFVKKMLIPSLVLVVIAAGLLFAINAGLILPNRLKSVTYDNGKGDTFSLKFYAAHDIKKLNEVLDIGEDYTALIGKKGKEGKAPLATMLYTSKTQSSEDSSSFDRFSGCGSSEPVATVRNDFADTDVSICSMSTNQDDDYMNMATFMKGSDVYIALFLQDIDYASIKDKDSAKKMLEKIGLGPYKEDIKQIVASIKPAQ